MTLNTASGQPTPMKDGEFISTSQPNRVSFGLKGIAPPSDLYVQRDDLITFTCVTGLSGGVVLTITARLLRAEDSQIVTVQKQFRVNPNYTIVQGQMSLAEGYLLSVTADDDSTTFPGLTFVSVFLQRSGTSFIVSSAGFVLFSDFTTNLSPVGWPGGRQLRANDGPGLYRSNTVANPVAGADWAIAVPAVAQWELVTIAATFAASAAVANRQIQIQGVLGGNAVWLVSAAVNITASQTAILTAMQTNALTPIIPTDVMIAIPPRLGMTFGFSISTLTAGIQAADQWSNIRVGVREFLNI